MPTCSAPCVAGTSTSSPTTSTPSCPRASGCRSGEVLEADLVVTATGLRLLPFGGIAPSVDGEEVDLSRAVHLAGRDADRSSQLRGLSRLHLRLVDAPRRSHPPPGVPGAQPHGARRPRWRRCRSRRSDLEERPILDLTSGYIQRSIADFPHQGDRGPWRVRQNYLLDSLLTLGPGLPSLEFTPRSAVSRVGSQATPTDAGLSDTDLSDQGLPA